MAYNPLKYGPVKNEDAAVKIPHLLAASETVRAKSGRFVTLNAGSLEMADDGDTLLHGWIEHPEGVTVAEDAILIPAHGCPVVFRIPINAGTYVAAMKGKTCDLVRSTVGGVTLIQGAKLDASGEDNLIIVDGDLASNVWVDVMFNPAKLVITVGVV